MFSVSIVIAFVFSGKTVPPGISHNTYQGMPPASHGLQFSSATPTQIRPPVASPVSKQPLSNDGAVLKQLMPQSDPNNRPQAEMPHIPPSAVEENKMNTESSVTVETEKKTERAEQLAPSRAFVDPLVYKLKELELEYITRDPSKTGRYVCDCSPSALSLESLGALLLFRLGKNICDMLYTSKLAFLGGEYRFGTELFPKAPRDASHTIFKEENQV